MTFRNCDLFKRSFTTQGIGYTFNNIIEENLIKKEFRSKALSPNVKYEPSNMISSSSDPSLTVVIENNVENKKILSGNRGVVHKPKKIPVSLHNPKEPSDTKFRPSTSIKIAFGHSTTFLVTPKAREIDDSGKQLRESERGYNIDIINYFF